MSFAKALVNEEKKLAVVGLGYVGLPLAVEFGKKAPTIGFDVNSKRIEGLQNGIDSTFEISEAELKESEKLSFSSDPADLKNADFIVVAVPTPITLSKQPDLFYIEKASETVGANLKKNSIVVYESTVYPGVTEDICVPILEEKSGLKCGVDFFVGYSPERINPGDKEHRVRDILKIVSGQNEEILGEIAAVYELVIKAGIYKAESIKCAEAAKVIENTQRDLNIALVNELAIIFDKMGIDTRSVLEAAGTKWNFIKMQPGLVGGHCIGVDPYYLTYKAEEMGYIPQVILAGRRINDGMGKYIAEQTVKHMIMDDKAVKNSKVLVMGITFKENVGDIRNSKVIDVVEELEEYGVKVSVIDPLADKNEVKHEYDLDLAGEPGENDKFDAVILAVNHSEFKENYPVERLKKLVTTESSRGVLIDVKCMYDAKNVESNDIIYWRL